MEAVADSFCCPDGWQAVVRGGHGSPRLPARFLKVRAGVPGSFPVTG